MAGRKKVVDTPEFQDAVGKAVAAQMASLEEKLLARANGDAPAPAGEDVLGKILSKLTNELQAVNQQGVRARPLSADEIRKRADAQNRLVDLLAAARTRPQAAWPKYKLTGKTYISERLIEPYYKRDSKGPAIPTEIAFTGVPNDVMVPLDDSAKEIFNAWRETTGGQTMLIPTADNRPLYVTAAGLVVKGDPPKRATVAADPGEPELAMDNNNPNSPEIAVLGTVARKARTNAVQGVQ